MVLTKKQRNWVYKKTLEEIKSEGCSFLCIVIFEYYLCKLYCKHKEPFRRAKFKKVMPRLLPELYAFKPDTLPFGGGWWETDDIESRIKALEICIKQTN